MIKLWMAFSSIWLQCGQVRPVWERRRGPSLPGQTRPGEPRIHGKDHERKIFAETRAETACFVRQCFLRSRQASRRRAFGSVDQIYVADTLVASHPLFLITHKSNVSFHLLMASQKCQYQRLQYIFKGCLITCMTITCFSIK